jgi:phytoene/squalene synthetase
VLRIAGYRDAALDASSDALCTALQLANFWQDFGRDWRSGRVYVPREVQREAGAAERDLAEAPAGPLPPTWTSAIARCIAVTRQQFAGGRDVCDRVRGRLRYELRLTWLGGFRILERVERARAELLTYRPALGSGDLPLLLWRAATWR